MGIDWHGEMQKRFKWFGSVLGFKSEAEVRISKGVFDCVWEIEEPVSEYFVIFEFETATTGSQIVANLVKVLSLPLQLKPRFLVQIYKNELDEKTKGYVKEILRRLPVAAKIIDDVGEDVGKASQIVVIELFNWIGEYAEISKKFLAKLERIIPKEKIVSVLHYGEGFSSHLKYLDNALRYPKNYLLCIKSIFKRRNKSEILEVFQFLNEYDVVILSDVSPKYCDMSLLKNFLENDVKQKGKSLILTGGVGLTEEYNELGEEYLGGIIGRAFHLPEGIYIERSEDNIGQGLKFLGRNEFRPSDEEEVVAWWSDNSPALVVHKLGKGNVVIFTSDCSPAWGTPSIESEKFKDMWKQIMEKYVIGGRR